MRVYTISPARRLLTAKQTGIAQTRAVTDMTRWHTRDSRIADSGKALTEKEVQP
jgi:hypothetical protein